MFLPEGTAFYPIVINSLWLNPLERIFSSPSLTSWKTLDQWPFWNLRKFDILFSTHKRLDLKSLSFCKLSLVNFGVTLVYKKHSFFSTWLKPEPCAQNYNITFFFFETFLHFSSGLSSFQETMILVSSPKEILSSWKNLVAITLVNWRFYRFFTFWATRKLTMR